MPHALACEDADEDAQRGAGGVGGGGAHAVEEVEDRPLEAELMRDQHDDEEEREADDRKAPQRVVICLEQLGECPNAENADRQPDDVVVRNNRVADEEEDEACPPGEINEVTEWSHGWWVER